MALAKSLFLYIAGLFGTKVFLLWWFDKPQNWDITITLLSGIVACGAAAGAFEQVEAPMERIFAGAIIISVWVFSIYSTANEYGILALFLCSWDDFLNLILAIALIGENEKEKSQMIGIAVVMLLAGGLIWQLHGDAKPSSESTSTYVPAIRQETPQNEQTQINSTANTASSKPPANTSTTPANSISQQSQPQNHGTTEMPPQSRQNTVSDVTLGNISIGDSFGTVKQILGTPYKEELKENGKKYYFYPSVEVHCKNGIVTTLVSNSSAASTPRGIHEGSSLQDVLSAYGRDYTKSNYGGLDLYEYTFPASIGQTAILRFAVNSSGHVDYISIR